MKGGEEKMRRIAKVLKGTSIIWMPFLASWLIGKMPEINMEIFMNGIYFLIPVLFIALIKIKILEK